MTSNSSSSGTMFSPHPLSHLIKMEPTSSTNWNTNRCKKHLKCTYISNFCYNCSNLVLELKGVQPFAFQNSKNQKTAAKSRRSLSFYDQFSTSGYKDLTITPRLLQLFMVYGGGDENHQGCAKSDDYPHFVDSICLSHPYPLQSPGRSGFFVLQTVTMPVTHLFLTIRRLCTSDAQVPLKSFKSGIYIYDVYLPPETHFQRKI